MRRWVRSPWGHKARHHAGGEARARGDGLDQERKDRAADLRMARCTMRVGCNWNGGWTPWPSRPSGPGALSWAQRERRQEERARTMTRGRNRVTRRARKKAARAARLAAR